MSTDARQPGPITFGELLSRAWRMYRAEPLLFLILTAVTVIPVGILSGIASAAATARAASSAMFLSRRLNPRERKSNVSGEGVERTKKGVV